MTDKVDEKKIAKAVKQAIAAVNKQQLNIVEQLLFIGNLGYSLGSSILGYKGTGPDPATIQQQYMQRPSAPHALILQSLQIILWAEDLLNPPHLITATTAKPEETNE